MPCLLGRADRGLAAGDEVIATFGQSEVTADQYASWLRFRKADDDPATRPGTVEDLALVMALAAEARKGGRGITAEGRSALEMVTERQLTAALRRHRGERIEVTEQEIDAALADQPDAFRKPPRVRLRTLFRRVPADADAEAREALRSSVDELRSQVLQGADFAELAKRESDSQARFRGGLVGNVEPGQLPTEIERIAFALVPGEVSEIVETEEGFSLLFCEDRLPARERPADEVRELTARTLRTFRVKEDWARYGDALVDRVALRFEDARPQSATAVIARYDGGEIALGDARAWNQVHGTPLPHDPSLEALKAAARQILIARLAAQEARELGLDRRPEVSERLTWEEEVFLATTELAAKVNERIEAPSDDAVRSYFEQRRDKFVRREHLDFSVILKVATEEDLPQRYREALALRERLVRGEIDFESAARLHSEHPSGADGGRLGPVERPRVARLGRNVFNTIVELAPGEISRLVQQDLGLWIVKLHAVEPGRPLTWEEARDAAEARLGEETTQRAREAVESELRRALALELVRSRRRADDRTEVVDQ